MTVEEAAHSNVVIKERALAQRKIQRLTRMSISESLDIVAGCKCDSTERSSLGSSALRMTYTVRGAITR